MTQSDAIVFTAELLSGLTFVAVLMVLWLQRGEFRAVARADWVRAFRNGALGWFAGLALLLALGLVLPGRPLLDTTHAATDLTVVASIFAGIGMMLFASCALNITLYRAAERLTPGQARWTAAAVALLYLVVAVGFGAAALA